MKNKEIKEIVMCLGLRLDYWNSTTGMNYTQFANTISLFSGWEPDLFEVSLVLPFLKKKKKKSC